MEKNYTEPKFEIVLTDETNKVFFAKSEEGPKASLPTISKTTGTW